jgi:hypothetical protein
MNQEFDAYIHEESDSGRSDGSRWNAPLIWTVLFILGFLVYEITARPAYGITIVCAKFGWNYFRSALWLVRVDPNRQRGWASFWLYLAAALAKIAITASMILLAFGILTLIPVPVAFQPQGNANAGVKEIMLAYVTAFVAFPLSGLVTIAALIQGARRKIKLWLDPRVEHARKQNNWPPIDLERFKQNRIYWLLGTTLMFFILPVWVVAVISPFVPMGPGRIMLPHAEIFVVLMTLIPAVGLVGIINFIQRRVIANTPQECWGDAESKYASP